MKFQLGRLLTSEVLKLRILEIIYKTFYSCHLNTRGKLILLELDSSELFSIKVGNNIILMSTYIISMYTYITCEGISCLWLSEGTNAEEANTAKPEHKES